MLLRSAEVDSSYVIARSVATQQSRHFFMRLLRFARNDTGTGVIAALPAVARNDKRTGVIAMPLGFAMTM